MQILKDEIRDHIITVARDEFYRRGYRNASMRVIAEQVGVSVSNVYNYFSGKEEIFYALTDTVHPALEALIKSLLAFREGKEFDNERFMQVFTDLVPAAVFSLIRQHRIDLLLILECSAGTKYADVKGRVIDTLAANFIENLQKTATARGDARMEHTFLMRVLAMNLVQGLVEIAREYRDDVWAQANIGSLMRYHIRGMVQFFT